MNTIRLPCIVDIERTGESFHAHALPAGVQIRPGDRVLIEGAPDHVDFGDKMEIACTATIIRAGALRRAWTEFTAILELTELFEVGFQPKEARP